MKNTRNIIALVVAMLSIGSSAPPPAGELPPLNDSPRNEHLVGKFIWADLFTGNPFQAVKFYSDLLGWTATTYKRDGGATYTLLQNIDGPVAGVVQRGANRPEGPGRWIGYVSVEDVSRAITAIEFAGGRALAPSRELPNRGTQALVADREGAVFGIMHSTSGDPGDYRPESGEWIWSELFARDPKAAGDFYRSVLKYDVDPDARIMKPDHLLLSGAGIARAGIGPLPEDTDAVPSWLGFVRVADLDGTVLHAVSLGGKVLVEPRVAEMSSRVAVIADPTGAAIGLVELTDNSIAGVQP